MDTESYLRRRIGGGTADPRETTRRRTRLLSVGTQLVLDQLHKRFRLGSGGFKRVNPAPGVLKRKKEEVPEH